MRLTEKRESRKRRSEIKNMWKARLGSLTIVYEKRRIRIRRLEG
jgi:hypothetical protein